MTLLSLLEEFNKALGSVSDLQIESSARLVLNTIEKGKSIFICGNGGSGANANLFAAALSGISANKRQIRVFSLNSNMPVITHAAESCNYGRIFSMQIANLAHDSDLLVAISGSGNSPNILEAVTAAKDLGMYTIGFTGMGGGKLSPMVDLPIMVKSGSMEQIETIHTVIIHAISTWVAEKVNGISH